MISADIQLGVSIGLGVLFLLSLSNIVTANIGGSASLPQLLIAFAALIFWGVSLTFQEGKESDKFDFTTLITAAMLAVATTHHYLSGQVYSGPVALMMGLAFGVGFYASMRYVQDAVIVAQRGDSGTEPPMKFTFAQPGAERCPSKSIDELVSDPDWITFVNGTKKQQRPILNKFDRKFHPVNCGSCHNVCTETFYYATTYLK